MQKPSYGGDAVIGAVFALGGAIAALYLFSAPSMTIDAPPIAPPQIPQPQIPQPQLPDLRLPQIPQNFLQQFRPAPAAPATDLAAMTPEQMREAIGMRVYKAVMQTPEGRGVCGSFPIAANQIATALHCVQGGTVELLSPDESQQFIGQVIWTDPANDAAIVQVDGVSLQPFPLAQAQSGEPVWAFGYPTVAGARLTVTPSQVLDTQAHGGGLQVPAILLPDGTYYPGNSGGPLINRRGEVVGIAHAITERPPHIGFAIPVNVLPR